MHTWQTKTRSVWVTIRRPTARRARAPRPKPELHSVDGEDGLAKRRTTEEWLLLLLHERVASSPRAAVVARAHAVSSEAGRRACARGPGRAAGDRSPEAQLLLLYEPVTGLGVTESGRLLGSSGRHVRAIEGSWPLAGATLHVDRRGVSVCGARRSVAVALRSARAAQARCARPRISLTRNGVGGLLCIITAGRI